MDFLEGKVIVQNGQDSVLADVALKEKTLILYYFTVHDNAKCKAFDVHLLRVYKEAIIRRVEMAIVIVGTDSDEISFDRNIQVNYNEYFNLKFNDDLIQILTYNYGVTHVPCLVVVRHNGEVVTKSGVREVEMYGVNVLVMWSI